MNIKKFAVVDLETSGLDPNNCDIIQVSATKFDSNLNDLGSFDQYIKVSNVSQEIFDIIHLNQKFLDLHGKNKEYVLDLFVEFIDEVDYIVGHNFKSFDTKFLTANGIKLNKFEILDTLYISRKYNKDLKSHKLDTLTNYYNIENKFGFTHNSFHDVLYEKEIFIRLCEQGYVPGEKNDTKFNDKSTKWTDRFNVKEDLPISNDKLIQIIKKMNLFTNKNICFSGKFKYHSLEQLGEIASQVDASFSKNVTKKTDVLIYTEPKGAKYDKAIEYNLELKSEKEIIELIKLEH